MDLSKRNNVTGMCKKELFSGLEKGSRKWKVLLGICKQQDSLRVILRPFLPGIL